MRINAIAGMALGIAGALASALPARAADLVLVGSNAINAILKEVVGSFERTSGHKVTMRLGIASVLSKEIAGGAPFDVTILVGPLDGLVKQGKVLAGTPVALGRSGYGLAVRAGAPKPDISTTEAFRRTMLDAKSVAYTKGGGSGAYFLRLLDKLGIAEAMKPKLRPGTDNQAAVARGDAEMTVGGIVGILRSPGVTLVGPLPPDLQSHSPFYAGVSAATKEKDAAMALLKHLSSPAAAAVFKKRGVEPMP